MIEQQIDVEVLAADVEIVPPGDERKTVAELEQEIFDAGHEGTFVCHLA